MQTPGLEEAINKLPPEQREQARRVASQMQGRVFDAIKSASKGETQYKTREFTEVSAITVFLTERSQRILSWQVIPDFKSFTYHLVYEETGG